MMMMMTPQAYPKFTGVPPFPGGGGIDITVEIVI